MTKTSLHQSFLGGQLDAYKNGLIWDTHLSYQLNDYRREEVQQEQEDNVDEFRRKIPQRCSETGRGQSRFTDDPHDNLTPIEDAEDISHVWTYFGKQTTFHGVKNTVCERRRQYSRLLWLLLVLGMSAGLVYTVAILLLEYYQYNTVTTTDVKINELAIFPSITMCNACPFQNIGKRKDTVLFRLAATTSPLLKHLFPLNFSDPEMIALLQSNVLSIQKMYAYKAEELFFGAKYENADVNISDAFEVTETTLGRCFTFNGPDYVAKNGPRLATSDGRESGLRLYVRLNQDSYFIYNDLTAGLRLFIAHPPDTPRLRKDGIDIHPGTSTRLAISPVKYTFLPAPYKSYGHEFCEETEEKDFRHKMINASSYSYNNCLEQCLSYKASLKCTCYTHLLYVPDLPMCSVKQMMGCFTVARETFAAASCDCPRPCSFTLYDSTMSASQMPSAVSAEFLRRLVNLSSTPELREDFLEIRVFLNTMMIRHERHESQYTFSSIFAFLGGQMGFFLGASLVTLVELLEAGALSVYVFFNKKLMRMGQLTTTSKVKPVNK